MHKKLLKILLLILIVQNLKPLNIIECCMDILKKDPIPFEYPVYKLLKENPIEKDITYFAIPWAQLLYFKKLNLLPKVYKANSFTVTRSTGYETLLPYMKKLGIKTVFCPHAVGKKYDGIEVVSMPHYNMNGIFANKKKDILYSFIGANVHPTRAKFFNLIHPKNACVIKRNQLHYFIDIREKTENAKIRKIKEQKEYQNILSRSRYSVCLSGTGPGTLRFWESLQAQAIPIIVTDIELPKGFNWNSCVIKIKEKGLPKIEKILKKISWAQEKKLRINCLKAYHKFCGDNIISVIKDYYK